MLKDFNKFIYEFENIYLKEIDSNIILKFIEDFYNYFLTNNSNIDNNILRQTINGIIIAIDDIILQKDQLKYQWIKKTAENKILHSNRGGEIFNNLIKDIIIGKINNIETIKIIAICFILGARSDYKQKFLKFLNETNNFYQLNYKDNIEEPSIYKYKYEPINLFLIFITITVLLFLFTEVYYIISIQNIINQISKMFFEVRSIYGK
jgi:hypothetical protein